LAERTRRTLKAYADPINRVIPPPTPPRRPDLAWPTEPRGPGPRLGRPPPRLL